jgi:hypothetical protein
MKILRVVSFLSSWVEAVGKIVYSHDVTSFVTARKMFFLERIWIKPRLTAKDKSLSRRYTTPLLNKGSLFRFEAVAFICLFNDASLTTQFV